MGIQSTQVISRDDAIQRIAEIQRLVAAQDYQGIEQLSFEPDGDVAEFVKSAVIQTTERWSDKMLENLMDTPFFRKSMFDNYTVV